MSKSSNELLPTVAKILASAGVAALLTGFDEPRGAVGHSCLSPDASLSFREVARFDVPEANQGVGVDPPR